jgi:hypothetical protein
MGYLENFMWEWLGEVEAEPDKVMLTLVKEFLHFYGYNNSIECIDAETTSMAAYGSHQRHSQKLAPSEGKRRDLCGNADIVMLLMRLFDAGCAAEFDDLWRRYVVSDSRESAHGGVENSTLLKMRFNSELYFVTLPIRRFHAQGRALTEEEQVVLDRAVSRFEHFLKRGGAVLSQDPSYAPYFSIPFVRPPHVALPRLEQFRPIFEAPGGQTQNPIDGDGGDGNHLVPLSPNGWVRGLRENLENFLINTLAQMPVPRLLRIYYAFKSDHALAREKMGQLSTSNQKLADVCNSLFTSSVQLVGTAGQGGDQVPKDTNLALAKVKHELTRCGREMKHMHYHKHEMLYTPPGDDAGDGGGFGVGIQGMVEGRKTILQDHIKVDTDMQEVMSAPHFTSWWDKGCPLDWAKIRVRLQQAPPSVALPVGELWRVELLGGLVFGIFQTPPLLQAEEGGKGASSSSARQLVCMKKARVAVLKIRECVSADIFARNKQTEGRKDVLQTLLLGKASSQWLLPVDDEAPLSAVTLGQMNSTDGFEGRGQRLLVLALMDCVASFHFGRKYFLQSGNVTSLLWSALDLNGQFTLAAPGAAAATHSLQSGLLAEDAGAPGSWGGTAAGLAFVQEAGHIFALLQKFARNHAEVREWLIVRGAVQWLSLWLHVATQGGHGHGQGNAGTDISHQTYSYCTDMSY